MKMELEIEGMSCQHCVHAVREALESLDGVEVVQVSIGTAHVQVDNVNAQQRDQIARAIADEGYVLSAAR